ncbi:hypothetical protein D9M71_324300 [compost metagenome]
MQAFAQGLGEAGHFLRAFFLVAQQHQEGAELGVLDLVVEHHAHGGAGFFARQVAGATLAFAEDPHELGERVLGRRFEGQRWVVGHQFRSLANSYMCFIFHKSVTYLN